MSAASVRGVIQAQAALKAPAESHHRCHGELDPNVDAPLQLVGQGLLPLEKTDPSPVRLPCFSHRDILAVAWRC
eukprot:CAMPEP_0172780650 /NCGR_PEP_ID=MMETSP1074-20121228/203035_1 /TAXON_ID=2916 /ORGANISM="Ceratium fusus, Strain PA161109" /LENGTH=73 /DNA_ID=CAMNT_0013617627 /DNA_START=2222 /DNA_END=2444 /DNA_ORIENTATION=+